MITVASISQKSNTDCIWKSFVKVRLRLKTTLRPLMRLHIRFSAQCGTLFHQTADNGNLRRCRLKNRKLKESGQKKARKKWKAYIVELKKKRGAIETT